MQNYSGHQQRSANELHTNNTVQRPQRTVLNFDDDSTDQQLDSGLRESLLKESGHLTRSEQLLDEQFELAIKTRESLVNQRSTISSMRDGFNYVTQQLGSTQGLMKKIRMRRRRDTIIIGVVFGLCLGLLLYNIFL